MWCIITCYAAFVHTCLPRVTADEGDTLLASSFAVLIEIIGLRKVGFAGSTATSAD